MTLVSVHSPVHILSKFTEISTELGNVLWFIFMHIFPLPLSLSLSSSDTNIQFAERSDIHTKWSGTCCNWNVKEFWKRKTCIFSCCCPFITFRQLRYSSFPWNSKFPCKFVGILFFLLLAVHNLPTTSLAPFCETPSFPVYIFFFWLLLSVHNLMTTLIASFHETPSFPLNLQETIQCSIPV